MKQNSLSHAFTDAKYAVYPLREQLIMELAIYLMSQNKAETLSKKL